MFHLSIGLYFTAGLVICYVPLLSRVSCWLTSFLQPSLGFSLFFYFLSLSCQSFTWPWGLPHSVSVLKPSHAFPPNPNWLSFPETRGWPPLTSDPVSRPAGPSKRGLGVRGRPCVCAGWRLCRQGVCGTESQHMALSNPTGFPTATSP